MPTLEEYKQMMTWTNEISTFDNDKSRIMENSGDQKEKKDSKKKFLILEPQKLFKLLEQIGKTNLKETN